MRESYDPYDPPYQFSLAGRQLKFSAIGKRHGGLTIPANGLGGDWIIKFPSQNYSHMPENEFCIMHLAAAIGIPVPQTKLVSLGEIEGLPDMGIIKKELALAVKRFDRTNTPHRVHMEDFAQVFNVYPENKYDGVSYEQITKMVWSLTGESGLTDFIRRLVFSLLTGNGGMHLKNWSFLYEDGVTPTLSPAYDLLSTVPYLPKDGLALKLSKTKDIMKITQNSFKALSQTAEVPERLVLDTLNDTLDRTREAWRRGDFDLPSEIKSYIHDHIENISQNIA